MAKWMNKLIKVTTSEQFEEEFFPLIMDMIEHEDAPVVAQGIRSFNKIFKKISEVYLVENKIALKILAKSYENTN